MGVASVGGLGSRGGARVGQAIWSELNGNGLSRHVYSINGLARHSGMASGQGRSSIQLARRSHGGVVLMMRGWGVVGLARYKCNNIEFA